MKFSRAMDTGPRVPVNAEREYRTWLLQGQEVRCLAAGVTGAILLVVGAFAPVTNGPTTGPVSSTGLGHGQGAFLLFAAVASLLHLRTWRQSHLELALLAAAFLAWKALFLPHLPSDVQPGWGWAPLSLGATLLILSGWPRQQAQKILPSI